MARFVIGTTSFPTKEAAKNAVRAILNGVDLEARITGDRAVFIAHLFALHPGAAEKAAPGVTGHMVRLNDMNGAITRGFHVIHPNNTTTAWSYLPCLNPRLSEPSFTGAMRAAIMLSQASFRRQVFGRADFTNCRYCGNAVERKIAHIHHEAPKFRDLVRNFVAEHGAPEVVSSANFGDDFANIDAKRLWIEYHDARAKRVLVCAPCNYAAERVPEPVC